MRGGRNARREMRNSRRLAPSSSSLRSDALKRGGEAREGEEVNGDTDLLCDEMGETRRDSGGFQSCCSDRNFSFDPDLSLSL